MANKQLKTSYNHGELSEYIAGREDTVSYHNGASKIINATVLPQGGFVKRSGTKYIATAPNKCNLLPFEFSVDDAFVLEFSNLLIRFYKDGALLQAGVGTEDLEAFDSATGDSSLVAHWLLNDNLATTAVLDDTVAGSHDGVATSNTEDLHETGQVGTGCFNLGGTDAVEVTSAAALTFGNGTVDSPFTIIAWVNVKLTGTTGHILTKWDTNSKREYDFYITSEGYLKLFLADQSVSKYPYRQSDELLTAGWHMVAATFSGQAASGPLVANLILLYVDGAVVASTATNEATYDAMESLGSDLVIGGFYDTGVLNADAFWDDKIDEVALFDKKLSTAEIASLYSIGNYSIVSPYTSAEAFEIHITQSADIMYIAHKDHHPQKLSRFGDTNWTIEDVPFTGGPFFDENTDATQLVGFARTGGTARSGYYFPAGATGTLTATAHNPFNSSMINGLWSVNHTRNADNTTSTPDNSTNAAPTLIAYPKAVRTKGDYVFNVSTFAAGDIAKLWRKQGNGEWQEFRTFTAATTFSATEDKDDVFYSFTIAAGDTVIAEFTAKNQLNQGVVKITALTSSTVVTVEVIDAVLSDNSTDNAVTTSMWAEGAWSDYRGYPRTVVFFEDRLWWASSTNNPDTLWSSKSGDYENMSFTDLGLDDEAITFSINDNEVSQVQWMQARQVMAVGAANKEYRFGASDPDKPVTPADRKATPQTSEGSHTLQPKILKDSIFFFQSLGSKLGKMKFDAITENFDVEDATMKSYRLFDSVPVDLAVQRVPDSIIWTVRTDGVMPTLTYEPKEEVLGWARQIFGNSAAVETPTGTVESVAVIHGSSEDEVWVSVLWADLSARHVMRFKPRNFGSDIDDAFYVDSGLTLTPAGTVVSGLDHLEGETVVVFGDGVVQTETTAGDFVVGGGAKATGVITVPSGIITAQVGLPYTMKVRTMRHSIPQEGTTIQSRIKAIKRTVVRCIRSLGGQAGQEYAGVEYLQNIEATFSTDAQDTTPNNRLAQGGFSEDAYTTIISSDPVPFTALAVIVDVEVEK